MLKNKKIIYIYGASGAGSTTLGRYICDKYNFKQIDTDDYFWKHKEEYSKRIEDMINDMKKTEKNGIVITGNFWNWNVDYNELLKYIDLYVRMILKPEIRIQRLKKREHDRFGEEILPGGSRYEEHKEFIEWAKQYDYADASVRSLKAHEYFEEKYNIQPILLDSENTIEENLEVVEENFFL